MRFAVGVVARLVVYAAFALLVADAVLELWRDENYGLSIAALIFFPVTIFVWPLTHLHGTVLGLTLWWVFAAAVVAYPISTFIGGLRPIDGPIPRSAID